MAPNEMDRTDASAVQEHSPESICAVDWIGSDIVVGFISDLWWRPGSCRCEM